MSLEVDWESGVPVIDDAYSGLPPQHGQVYPLFIPDDLKWWDPLPR